MTDGALRGQNRSKGMCQGVAAVGSNESSREWADNTPFETLSGTFVIKNGIAHNDDFRLDIPGIRFKGAGEANLPASRFDYAMKAGFINTAADSINRPRAPLPAVFQEAPRLPCCTSTQTRPGVRESDVWACCRDMSLRHLRHVPCR